MSGILNSKSRVMDAILTAEGRRQMAAGTFEVSFVTFTDADVAYIPSPIPGSTGSYADPTGHVDPTDRIYFEACDLPQDQVTFEANDEGRLVPFRKQDIRVKTSLGNISSSYAAGTLTNGRLTTYQYHHGRRIKVGSISENYNDLGKGFVYSDRYGLTGSILIDPRILAGTGSFSVPTPGAPYIAYVGTRGGMGPQQFADEIDRSIRIMSSSGGPAVTSDATNSSVYLDDGDMSAGTNIFATGSLSSPLSLEDPLVGGRLLTDEIEDAAFASQITGILTSSFDNFRDLQTLSSIDRLYLDELFELSTNELLFDLSKLASSSTSLKTSSPAKSPPALNVIDSLFSDDKMSHLDNFLYLPPIVKVSDSVVPDKTDVNAVKPYLLGGPDGYPSWGDNEKRLSYSQLMKQLNSFSSDASPPPVVFAHTSNNNSVMGQFFEVTKDSVQKLDVVDFGMAVDDDSTVPPTNKVFFVGKTFLDDRGTTCFVNMFTLMFEHQEKS